MVKVDEAMKQGNGDFGDGNPQMRKQAEQVQEISRVLWLTDVFSHLHYRLQQDLCKHVLGGNI